VGRPDGACKALARSWSPPTKRRSQHGDCLNQILPEKIISVMLQPAKHLAVGGYEAKYRVLYLL
jgi:hypothetical protein